MVSGVGKTCQTSLYVIGSVTPGAGKREEAPGGGSPDQQTKKSRSSASLPLYNRKQHSRAAARLTAQTRARAMAARMVCDVSVGMGGGGFRSKKAAFCQVSCLHDSSKIARWRGWGWVGGGDVPAVFRVAQKKTQLNVRAESIDDLELEVVEGYFPALHSTSNHTHSPPN